MARKKETKTEKLEGISLIAEEIAKQELSLHKASMMTDLTIPTIVKMKKGEPCDWRAMKKMCDALGLELVIRKKQE